MLVFVSMFSISKDIQCELLMRKINDDEIQIVLW